MECCEDFEMGKLDFHALQWDCWLKMSFKDDVQTVLCSAVWVFQA